jgi:glutaredoxin
VRRVTVYSKPDCHLCQQAISRLQALSTELSFELTELDITLDEALHRAYFERIPVIALDGEELFDYFVDERILRARLSAGAQLQPEGGSRPEHPLESRR